jgi:16S rRNA (cytidine1402-2'-O)-methyltransferase
MTPPGRLFLLPAPIGDGDPLEILSPEVVATYRNLRHFVVESERSAGRLLSRLLPPEALTESAMYTLNEHSDPKTIPGLLEPALGGRDLGILSEAGCPCVADPGADLVTEAHRLGIRVVPLPGPSSILQALMASGFPGQRFEFLGYLPPRGEDRRQALKREEREAVRDGSTRIFIETPYRNQALLSDALAVLEPETRFCAALSLGGSAERVVSMEIRRWRTAQIQLAKEPAVFLLAPKAVPGTLAGRPSVEAALPKSSPKPGTMAGHTADGRGSRRTGRDIRRQTRRHPGA